MLAIINARVVTVDAQGTIIDNATIVVDENGLIREIAPGSVAHTATTVIDARGGIVMPGLVNAHAHLGMTLFRGLATPTGGFDVIFFRAKPEVVEHGKMVLGTHVALIGFLSGVREVFFLGNQFRRIPGEGGDVRAVSGKLLRSLLGFGLVGFAESLVVDLPRSRVVFVFDIEKDQTPGHRLDVVRLHAEADGVDETHDEAGAGVPFERTRTDPGEHGLGPLLVLRLQDLRGQGGPRVVMTMFGRPQKPLTRLSRIGFDVGAFVVELVQGVFCVRLFLVRRLAQPDDRFRDIFFHTYAQEQIPSVK